MTRVHIKTTKDTDSLGTRYHVNYFKYNDMATTHRVIDVFESVGDAKETAFMAYAQAVNEYGIDNVYVSQDF